MLRRTRLSFLFLTVCLLSAPDLQAQDAQTDGDDASEEAVPSSGEYVEFMTGERRYGRVELHAPVLRSRYLTIDGSERVDLDDVRAYQNEEGYFRRVGDTGSAFARRVRQGRLDLYERSGTAVSPLMMMPGAPGAAPLMMGGGMTTTSFGYFAKGEAEVHPLKYGPLREAVSDDPQSLQYLNQYRTLGFVQGGLVAAGLGIVAVGLTQLEKQQPPPPLLFVGAGVASTAWIPHLMRSGKLEAAVDSYNRYQLEP